MTKVIEFYIPKNFQNPPKGVSQLPLGRVIEFCSPATKSASSACTDSSAIGVAVLSVLSVPSTKRIPGQKGILLRAAFSDRSASAMKTGKSTDVGRTCAEFLDAASEFYGVPDCGIRVLTARPLRVRESGTTELFGDYSPETMLIRVWMRTAVRKEVTSFGTFLSTLCHEFCHHLDYQKLGFHDSWHTRGFYERAAVLYHYARGTLPKKLVWLPTSGERWRIDWPQTNRGA